MKGNILTQDKVASTISIINQYLRMALHQSQTKNPKFLYYLFKGNTVEDVVDFITIRNAKSALVIDDIGLQIINRLLQEGVTDITLCLARFPKELMTTVKYIIQNSFPSIKINIIHYEEISMIQNVDLIISNPAYSAIGANITYNVKDLNYKEFINLLPANDYKRNSDKNLFNFQSDMIAINDGFEDAAVTTHLARIHKDKVNDMTLDEFEISQYIDPQLDKYFRANAKRISTVEDKYLPSRELVRTIGPAKSLIFTKRDVSHKHLPYSKKVNSYKWNIENSITADYLIENTAVDFNNTVSIEMLICNSEQEKANQVNFYYSRDGFRLLSKIFTAVNVDSRIELIKILPKVDWTRAWTVEEILADYGYTETEIAEVMADLENFKGMEN